LRILKIIKAKIKAISLIIINNKSKKESIKVIITALAYNLGDLTLK
jgi:hypothetical protein